MKQATLLLIAILVAGVPSFAQTGPNERTFPQAKSAVEAALKELRPALAGRLPVLDGFATQGEHPLNRYQRGFYQTAVQVSPAASGGTVVKVNAKVTAWYADSSAAHSGYELLKSNGRLEADLLDQLSDLLGSNPAASSGSTSGAGTATMATQTDKKAEATIPAPVPRLPDPRIGFSSAMGGLSSRELADSKNAPEMQGHPATGLQAEAASLEEVLKNQAHPKNLVAIKKSGTPVVATPSLNGKTLFLASAQDEFEMLDFSEDWVHVRISGLSRGWIWRTSLEMPEGISDVPTNARPAKPVVADLFQVSREETAPFPGDWEPLRGKNVRIISVQKIQENERDSGAQAKLEFAKSLLDKNYADLAAKSKELAGIVFIFDSIDGGMIAATLPTVQQWKAGTLSDAALWHRCYFDPPETFAVSNSSGGSE